MGKATCTGPDCGRVVHARGLCSGHYRQQQRGAEPRPLAVSTVRTCTAVGCNKVAERRQMCSTHYSRWRRTGTTDYTPPTAAERRRRQRLPSFWERVEVGHPAGCWVWTGTVVNGYGQVTVDQRRHRAHRYAWTLLIGPIPAGLQMDHLCRNTLCVNPDHLRLATPAVNTLASENTAAKNARKSHCKRGHRLSGRNVYRYINSRGRPARQCRECQRQRQRI